MDVFLNTMTWDVFFFLCLVLICCLQSKGTRISSRKQDDLVGCRSLRSSTSGRWLEKSGKHVGPNLVPPISVFTSVLQNCSDLAFVFGFSVKFGPASLLLFSSHYPDLSSFCAFGNLQNHPVSLKIYASLLIANSKSLL